MPFLIATAQPDGLLYGLRCTDGEIIPTADKKQATRFDEAEAETLVQDFNRFASTPWELFGVKADDQNVTEQL